MPPRAPRSETDFVSRHGLWNAAQARAAVEIERMLNKRELEVVRFSFPDQHGVLRGKTLIAAEAARAMRNGVTMTTTLLAKDTSHRSVFPVFTAGGGFGMAEMEGGADFVMIADPLTFRVLPWAERTGWLLCDIYFFDGKPVPFSTRARCREALASLHRAGFEVRAGPEVGLLTQGYQYLTESRYDMIAPALDVIRRGVEALDLPLRSVEVELGPSQVEFTFRPQSGLAS